MKTVEAFVADIDVSDLADLLLAVPVAEWPKMIDPAWREMGDRLAPLAAAVMAYFPGCAISGVGLFLLAPGQEHPAHRDEQPPEWVIRVHVPIVTNPLATVTTADGTFHMAAGKAYRFDTRAMHAVRNGGTMPRVHFVCDVKRQ